MTIDPNEGQVFALHFSPIDPFYVVCGSETGTVTFFDLRGSEQGLEGGEGTSGGITDVTLAGRRPTPCAVKRFKSTDAKNGVNPIFCLAPNGIRQALCVIIFFPMNQPTRLWTVNSIRAGLPFTHNCNIFERRLFFLKIWTKTPQF